MMLQSRHSLFDLSGKLAIVTGGGSGLGREFCDVLAEFGADIVCSDLNRERAEETCAIVRSYGINARAVEMDVSKYDQVQAMFELVERTFGRLDVLINNAGIINKRSPIHQLDPIEWHRVVNVNLHGTFYCMKEGLSLMMKQGKGSIINNASVTGLCGTEPEVGMIAPYATSKSAVIGLTRQAAAEYGRYGIRVNSIAPGWHLGTNLGSSSGTKRSEEELKAWRQLLDSKTPMRRTGDPRELRGLVLYLASDASSFVTGQVIASDGGWACV
ncbi:MAG: NAD(P)-dependent oxidoreductase [Deltaproteobacteria bacterium HGW-Deltaproteobacteria-21]|nr:MAG: NAD(P)-dependent oxidoreductase [Deltaproteobacteria bacterium HGW-Deltaproteobacteria-21]